MLTSLNSIVAKILSFCLALCSLQSCISYEPVTVKGVQSVKIKEATMQSATVEVKLRVSNPNTYKIKVKDYDLEGFVNGNSLGKVNVDGAKLVFPKKSEQDYVINLKPDVSKIISMLPGLMLTQSAMINIKGNVKVKALIFSRSFPIDLNQKVSKNDFIMQ